MTADDLTAALRARASGFCPLEAGTELLIANGAFLHRHDFTSRFIENGTSITDGTTPMASVGWDAAVTALDADGLPCSGGERRILRLSASLAAGVPVSLRDTVTGLDNLNTALLIGAIRHASGWRCDASRNSPLRPSPGAEPAADFEVLLHHAGAKRLPRVIQHDDGDLIADIRGYARIPPRRDLNVIHQPFLPVASQDFHSPRADCDNAHRELLMHVHHLA